VSRVMSKDRTEIVYERRDSGPAVILAGGALDDGSENAELVPALAENFTATARLSTITQPPGWRVR
jgi:hypothetical protein